jgi:hypothetical protein
VNCDECGLAEQIDGRTKACEDGRGCPIPQPDADGARALSLRARLVALPAGVSGEWLLDRLGAGLWDLEMISVIEEEVARGCDDGR